VAKFENDKILISRFGWDFKANLSLLCLVHVWEMVLIGWHRHFCLC
jgi:hypothetical protein